MKIQGNDNIVKSVISPNVSGNVQPAGNGFQELLKEAVNDGSAPEIERSPNTLLGSLSPIQLNPASIPNNNVIAERIDKFLGLLDNYRRSLGDPQLTLKKVDAVVKELDNEKERLQPILDTMPEGDRLKDVLNQTLVTAATEIMKFKRGDYVSSDG